MAEREKRKINFEKLHTKTSNQFIYPFRYTLIAFHFIYLMRHLMHSDSRTALTVGIFQSICIGVATTKTHIPAVEYPNHSDEFKME